MALTLAEVNGKDEDVLFEKSGRKKLIFSSLIQESFIGCASEVTESALQIRNPLGYRIPQQRGPVPWLRFKLHRATKMGASHPETRHMKELNSSLPVVDLIYNAIGNIHS